jgi:hypothetical protein
MGPIIGGVMRGTLPLTVIVLFCIYMVAAAILDAD